MIAGTFIFETTSIQWNYSADTQKFVVRVQDSLSGTEDTRSIPPDEFLAALSIALHPDGEPFPNLPSPLLRSDIWGAAENAVAAFGTDKSERAALRFIP